MSSSEISLLCKELAMVITENRTLQKKISENETTFTSKITLPAMEIDLLRLELQHATEDWKNTRVLNACKNILVVVQVMDRLLCTTVLRIL